MVFSGIIVLMGTGSDHEQQPTGLTPRKLAGYAPNAASLQANVPAKRKKQRKPPAIPPGWSSENTARSKGPQRQNRHLNLRPSLEGEDLKDFAKGLKQKCGSGGSVKDGVIIIQGDHREAVAEAIRQHGYTVKLARRMTAIPCHTRRSPHLSDIII